MDKILSINTIKNVFSALGAKTTDSNYGVALLDKTSGEPKGIMGMSDLASVLGVGDFIQLNNTDVNVNDLIFSGMKLGIRYYSIVPAQGKTISGLPNGFENSVSCLTNISFTGYDQIQIVWSRNQKTLYYRIVTGSSFSNWFRLDNV